MPSYGSRLGSIDDIQSQTFRLGLERSSFSKSKKKSKEVLEIAVYLKVSNGVQSVLHLARHQHFFFFFFCLSRASGSRHDDMEEHTALN